MATNAPLYARVLSARDTPTDLRVHLVQAERYLLPDDDALGEAAHAYALARRLSIFDVDRTVWIEYPPCAGVHNGSGFLLITSPAAQSVRVLFFEYTNHMRMLTCRVSPAGDRYSIAHDEPYPEGVLQDVMNYVEQAVADLLFSLEAGPTATHSSSFSVRNPRTLKMRDHQHTIIKPGVLHINRTTPAASGPAIPTGRHNRLHEVREHFRTYKSGKRIVIRSHTRGDANAGIVVKPHTEIRM